MFHSSSSSPYDDPAFCCAAGPAPLTGTLYPYAAAAFFDATAAAATSVHTLSSSLPSNNYFMHRSSSTHSFAPSSVPDPTPAPSPFFSSSSPPSACDLLDFHSEPVRRVFSTGDLQGSTENCIQEGAAAAGQVRRYTGEERMKRIERYRSKRNQRNFHKKITYACRKTLADSRPRVRGRFARNGEMETETEPEMEPEVEAEVSASEISYDSYNNHHSNNDNCASYNNYDNGGRNAGEWWRQMQAALATTEEEEECCYDEEIWASFGSVFSMNLLS